MGKRTEKAKLNIKIAVAHDAAMSQQRGTANAPLGSSSNPSNAIFTLANIITFCRFVLTGVFLYLFVQHDAATRPIAITCYAIAACSDFVDGQVARRTNTVSWLGKIMDPIMDRVLLFTGVLGLVLTDELPLWMAVVVVLRDVVLAAGSMWLRMYQTRPMDVIYLGKVATTLLMAGFGFMLVGQPEVRGLSLFPVSWLPGFNGEPVALSIYLVYAGIVCSLATAVIYYQKGLGIRKDKRSVHVRM